MSLAAVVTVKGADTRPWGWSSKTALGKVQEKKERQLLGKGGGNLRCVTRPGVMPSGEEVQSGRKGLQGPWAKQGSSQPTGDDSKG